MIAIQEKQEIVGNINDATFSYTLSNFMQGDEVFYCKINIDGEDHYKEIKVIQGDVVTYEEDFAGIVYSNGAAVWVDDYGEGLENEMFQVDVTKGIFDDLDYGTHDIQITQSAVSDIASRYPNFYIDAIKIYK